MSDEAGKTRRNLMVFSTGVLAVAYLQIPLSSSKFLGLDLNQVDPFAAWVCAFLVLIYLTLRYWHDATFQAHRADWKKREKEIQQKLSATLIRWSFHQRRLGRRWTPVSFSSPPPPVNCTTPSLEGYIEFNGDRKGSAKIIWTGGTHLGNGSYAAVYVREDWIKFKTGIVPFVVIALITMFRMMRINWILLEIAVPLGLATVAGLFIIAMIYVAGT